MVPSRFPYFLLVSTWLLYGFTRFHRGFHSVVYGFLWFQIGFQVFFAVLWFYTVLQWFPVGLHTALRGFICFYTGAHGFFMLFDRFIWLAEIRSS